MRQNIRKGLQTFSMLFFPLFFVFFSPYIIVVSASMGVVNGSAMMFTAMLISSIFASRLFCGWLCPGGKIQDVVAEFQGRPWNGPWKNRSKYILWIIWFTPILFLYWKYKPLSFDFFKLTEFDPHLIIVYFAVVTLIYLFCLLTGKRGMCHSFCWMAPFMVLGEKTADLLHIPRFRIKGHADACISCKQCTKKCPMSLDVATMVKSSQMENSECIGCYECVDVCPKKAVRAGFYRK